MRTDDFLLSGGIAVLVAASIYFGLYWLTVLAGLLYFLLLTSIIIHYVTQPLPRIIVGFVDFEPEEDGSTTVSNTDSDTAERK